jgi:hypothetical protein
MHWCEVYYNSSIIAQCSARVTTRVSSTQGPSYSNKMQQAFYAAGACNTAPVSFNMFLLLLPRYTQPANAILNDMTHAFKAYGS